MKKEIPNVPFSSLLDISAALCWKAEKIHSFSHICDIFHETKFDHLTPKTTFTLNLIYSFIQFNTENTPAKKIKEITESKLQNTHRNYESHANQMSTSTMWTCIGTAASKSDPPFENWIVFLFSIIMVIRPYSPLTRILLKAADCIISLNEKYAHNN